MFIQREKGRDANERKNEHDLEGRKLYLGE